MGATHEAFVLASAAMSVSPYLIYPLPRDVLRAADACKVWQGTYDSNGYPRFKSRGQSRYVARAVYEDFHGRLEPGEKVYRVCGDRRCVNALHLVTTKPGPKGKRRRPGTAKLTARRVREIRLAWAGSPRPTQVALAEKYGVSRSAVSLVVRGVTWTDISVPAAPESAAVTPAVAPVRLSPLEMLRSRMIQTRLA